MDVWGLNTEPVNPGPLRSGQKLLWAHFLLLRVRTRNHQDLAVGIPGSRVRGQSQSLRAERLTSVAPPTTTRDTTRRQALSVQCKCPHQWEPAPQSFETFGSLLYSLVFTSLISHCPKLSLCVHADDCLLAKYLLALEKTKMSPTW